MLRWWAWKVKDLWEQCRKVRKSRCPREEPTSVLQGDPAGRQTGRSLFRARYYVSEDKKKKKTLSSQVVPDYSPSAYGV